MPRAGRCAPHTNCSGGGNTKFYGAALFRLPREGFGEIKHWGVEFFFEPDVSELTACGKGEA
jgi:hypothetical protein